MNSDKLHTNRKKMKKYYLGLLFFFLIVSVNSQVIQTEPALPLADQPVIIYFHSDLETGALKNYTAPLYAHTGVNFSDGVKWQNVIGSWGNNTTQPMLEYTGNYTYKLAITPDVYSFYNVSTAKSISQIALVIRNAAGNMQTSPDIFVDLFEAGLQVNFTLPVIHSSVVELNQTFPVTANAILSDSLALYKNGEYIDGTNSSQTLSHSFLADTPGDNEVVVKAFSATDTISDTIFYFVRPEPAVEVLPAYIRDGINYISDTSVILCLYAPFKNYSFVLGDFNSWSPGFSGYMKKTPDGLRYWIQVDGLEAGKEYGFQYLVDGNTLIGDPYTDKVLDPWNDEWISNSTYPGLKPYPKNFTTGPVSVLQTAQIPYTWKHDDFIPPVNENAVIYELLVRDFIAAHDWKTLADTLNYFTKLGITALEIMPFNEFDGNESWGYLPSCYFAPDKYYGPKNDLKAFVDSCHSRGIAVIMDIVLNHSSGLSPLVQLYWNPLLNRPAADNPWYNEVSPNTTYSWGYDFNHESLDTKKFVDSVTSYWLNEYKIDGYRFDFTKGFTNTPGDGGAYDAPRIAILKRMADKIWEVKPSAYIILEHFADNSEETILANYGMMIWGNSNYNYNEAAMGWNDSGKSNFTWVSYKTRGWSNPKLVGYMESHDEERLMVKTLLYGNTSGDYDTRQLPVALRRVELAAAFFITIPGPKMIWQFEEMGYDVPIDFNGRTGNKPRHWEYLDSRPRMNPVFSSLIRLKTMEPAFSTNDFSLSVSTAVKRIELNHADMDVRIIGNFDVVSQSANPDFSKTGTWYDYFSGESLEVSNVNDPISLLPGEYRIYTTKALEKPQLPTTIRSNVIQKGQFRIFPNPVNEALYVESGSKPDEIRITDLTGRTMKVINPKSGSISLDFSDMKPGIYFLIIQQGDRHSVEKVVKN